MVSKGAGMNSLVNNAGSLDTGFAEAGIFTLKLEGYSETLILGGRIDPASQAIYFTGQARNGVSDRSWFIGCLTPDGNLDPDFGTRGITSGKFGNLSESKGLSIAFLSQGKILLIAETLSSLALARLHPDGSPDTTYGEQGQLIIGNPAATNDTVAASAPSQQHGGQSIATAQADGRIVVAHTYQERGNAGGAYLFMLKSDGTLDLSFNHRGHVKVEHPDHQSAAVNLLSGLMDEDGNAVACGLLTTGTSSAALFVRYTREGYPDPAFGDRGFVINNGTGQYSRLVDLTLQGNKRMLGCGRVADRSYSGLLISLERDGKFNIQFNQAKPLLTRLGNNDTQWSGARQQSDGKIVVVGSMKPASASASASVLVVARFQSNGDSDPTFANGAGWVATPVGSGSFNSRGVMLQGDGKIVAFGYSTPSGDVAGSVLRYFAN
ncbi:putative delta-60 repeat protein [Pseudomonas baetica]|uniref:Delta-60 repeat protein n=2 Tax=Pseudomonas baetica TaxID=674054 RepID=A0ABX4PVC3_9PSED|nr:putative delta-60 repeat protein [Pseudomonas baetica]PTC18503.1 hypothetical protein C0J26_21185 [Pseudomonas baetica]